MRQWRVGTLSGGLLLIITGSALLYAQFNKLAVFDTVLKWWPVIFILLGLEVLLQSYLQRQEDNKVKYDILSIIIILFIVLFGVGIQTFRELGLADRIRLEVSSQVFVIQDHRQIPLDAGIHRVILETDGSQVNIHNTSGNSITAQYSLHVRSQSQNQAQEYVEKFPGMSEKKEGDTVYIHLNSGRGDSSLVNSEYSLLIPANVAVEMTLEGGQVTMQIDSVSNNWDITGPGSCNINLPALSDATITALLDNQVPVSGNLAWIKSNVVSNESNGTGSIGAETVQRKAVLGQGKYRINIRQVDELKIYQL